MFVYVINISNLYKQKNKQTGHYMTATMALNGLGEILSNKML